MSHKVAIRQKINTIEVFQQYFSEYMRELYILYITILTIIVFPILTPNLTIILPEFVLITSHKISNFNKCHFIDAKMCLRKTKRCFVVCSEGKKIM